MAPKLNKKKPLWRPLRNWSTRARFDSLGFVMFLLFKFGTIYVIDLLEFVFMDLESVSVHKHAKENDLGQYPAMFTSRLVNNTYKKPTGRKLRVTDWLMLWALVMQFIYGRISLLPQFLVPRYTE